MGANSRAAVWGRCTAKRATGWIRLLFHLLHNINPFILCISYNYYDPPLV